LRQMGPCSGSSQAKTWFWKPPVSGRKPWRSSTSLRRISLPVAALRSSARRAAGGANAWGACRVLRVATMMLASFGYGQRHRIELCYARQAASWLRKSPPRGRTVGLAEPPARLGVDGPGRWNSPTATTPTYTGALIRIAVVVKRNAIMLDLEAAGRARSSSGGARAHWLSAELSRRGVSVVAIAMIGRIMSRTDR
jgi:hypothetical protein